MKYRRSAKRKRGSAQPQGIDRRYSGFVPDHCGYSLRRRRTRILLLPVPLFQKRRFAFFDVRFVAGRIDERVGPARFHLFVLRFQAEIVAVGAQEKVHRQAFENLEGLHIIVRDLRIIFVADENRATVHVRATDDHRIQLTPAFIDLHGPRGAALRVAGSQMRDEFRASEFNRVSVMQHAIDFRGGASLRVAFGVGNVSVHDHQPRSGLFLDDAYGCIMIAVRMTGKDDLGVAVFETELSDALFNGRHVFGKIRVDENVSLGRVDQVNGEIVGLNGGSPMRRVLVLLSQALLAAVPALAQQDLTGEYISMFHEDQPERIPGPALGDYLGLPISDAARAYAEAWDASRMTLKEHQCMVHVAPYIFRGPGPVRIWQEKDQETQEVTAIKIYHGTYQQTRTIWMDGRPHPSESALHTWMGFSTGKWEGDTLTIYTTHIKQGWLRRNGLPESDRATLTEHFIKHGDILTRMSMITDPVYLTEPLVKTDDFIRNTHLDVNWIWPCEPVEEVVTRAKGAVPHYLPGTNAFLKEFQETVHVPEVAQRGGAQTMYPEFKTMLVAGARTAPAAVQPAIQQRQIAPDSEIHVIPVRENIWVLTGPGGNVTVQVGKQGILLVDTMSGESSERVLASIAKLSSASLRYF